MCNWIVRATCGVFQLGSRCVTACPACRQHATGKRGLYRTLLVEQRPMSLAKDFRPQAVEDESLPPAKETPEEVERRFWRNVNLRPPLYGADVPGSLFDEDLKVQQPCLCSQQTQEQPVAAQFIIFCRDAPPRW